MIRRVWILGGLLALAPAVSQAALVMLVDGVPGPSTVLNHVGWFDIDSVSWSIERGNTTAPQKFVVVIKSSAGVATLMQASASGTGLKKIVIDTVFTGNSSASQVLDSRLTCEGTHILNFGASGHAQDREQVSLSLQCGRILWEKYDYTSAGQPSKSGKGSWNFKTNTP